MSTRSFIALPLDDTIKNALVETRQTLRQALGDLAKGKDDGVIRWNRPQQFHLTLDFLGNLDDGEIEQVKDRVRTASQKIEPFSLELGALGSFGRPTKVIWVGIRGDTQTLQTLHEHVAVTPKRSFRPHLTLGRVKHPPNPRVLKQALSQVEVPTRPWLADEVVLYESVLEPRGARHTPLLRCSLV